MSDGIKRRDFLKVLGVGSAGAATFGCSTQEVEKLLPYVTQPEEITPGVATWYASVCGECPAQCGIWVKTREGRAIKIEGNPSHPVSRGALCSRGHASLQGLYNPDRFTGPMRRQGSELVEIGWDEAEALLAERLRTADGAVRFITGKSGPSFTDLVESFVSAVGGRRVEYEALSEAPLREAVRIAYGRDVIPTYDLSEARLILSFGADFLETWLSPVEYGAEFASAAAVDEHGSKGRFVFLGPRLSLTGQNADEWLPIRPGSEAQVALAMAGIIARNGGDPGPYAPLLKTYDAEAAARVAGVEPSDIAELADRFVREGPSVALGPGVAGQHRAATAANLAILVLNHVAGNVGTTVHLGAPHRAAASAPYSAIEGAVREMAAGDVQVALVHGTNPAYSLPPASGFREAFQQVDFKVSFASTMDETAALADLVLPDRHFLEAWDDSNPRPGVYALQQPAMVPVPMFDTRPTGDVLLSAAGTVGQDLGAATFRDWIRGRWQEVYATTEGQGTFDAFWRNALRTGVVEVDAAAEGEATLRTPDTALSFEVPNFDGPENGLVLLVYPSPRFGDGKHANRPWLQELPDPVSKIMWHGWVEVNPSTAERLGLREGDVVRVTSAHGEVEVPVWLSPGVREDAVALAMGGGHDQYGRYADGNGVNPMALLPAESEQPSGTLVKVAVRVTLEPTGRRQRLVTTEGSAHQEERHIAPAVALAELRAGTQGGGAGGQAAEAEQPAGEGGAEGGHEGLQELQGVGGFVPVPTEGKPTDFPLEGSRHGSYDHTQPRWAMSIDLDRCTGCSACVTACQAENNVPWVGQEQALMGRELHWIRLERFYEHVDATRAGPLDVRHLPMLCQHCGNAPCEPVCPVYAAYHTPEGLNAQVYNRCVGTRYCANNCPYKVRVFNWYTYTDVPEPMNWQYNPDVTVRENGVMEKCTFCVQRIREAQNKAVLEGREVREGDITPACQQSCPAQAITFGNIRDERSSVARLAENERTYRVLDEHINTKPAIGYLKKVTFHAVESGEPG